MKIEGVHLETKDGVLAKVEEMKVLLGNVSGFNPVLLRYCEDFAKAAGMFITAIANRLEPPEARAEFLAKVKK